MMSACYEHQPLTLSNSIRLVILEPTDSAEGLIRCSLEEVDLDNITTLTAYEALSYVWGEPVGTIPISCHGKSLLVTPNCHDALVQLRSSSKRRRFFIDAICIDQRKGEGSVRERESQVARMGQADEKAARVVVWLGKPHPGTRRLWKLLRLLRWAGDHMTSHETRDAHTEKVFLGLTKAHGLIKAMIRLLDFGRDDSDKIENAFSHLLKNPWYSRLWTLQELILADPETCVAFCGPHEITYAAIERGMIPLIDLFNIWRTRGNALLPLERGVLYYTTRFMSSEKYALHPNREEWACLLWHNSGVWSLIRNLDATVPHDKIFGLYAISTRFGLNLPRPDYSTTAAEIFEASTREVIRQTKSLAILTLCIREVCATENLASWVPDWATKMSTDPDPYSYESAFLLTKGYTAGGHSDMVFRMPTMKGGLIVRCVIIGTVSFLAVSSEIKSFQDLSCETPAFGGFSKACQSWCRRVALLPDTYCTGCPTYEAAQRTLLINSEGDASGPMRKRQELELQYFSEIFDLFLYPNCKLHDTGEIKVKLVEHARLLGGDSTRTADGGIISDIDDLGMVLISYIIDILSSRKEPLYPVLLIKWVNYALLILDTGHFARGPYVCKEGDVVALLAGYHNPVALRPDGNGNYRFVAPLYVDGIMYGEAWPEDEATLEEIVLV